MLSILGRNLMFNALAGTATASPIRFASLHTAPPGDTGLNEVSTLLGTAPFYGRVAVSFASAVSGVLPMLGALTFNVPPAVTVAFVGLWSDQVGGTFLGSAPIGSNNVYGAVTALIATNLLTCPGHGLMNGNAVILTPVAGASLPTPFQFDTLYYVINVTTDTFQLSASLAGPAVNLSADGRMAWQLVTLNAFVYQGTLTVAALTLSLES